ncbi:BrnT family toxin [Xanthobacter tagetidis]|uniref:BrnT family toxin n=2 Tax=Xanthobacter tagetidis TaxID=60216 RepID=A0A3L7AJ79_9HYPH|nr:BrnT family toxin [Xanthobacter tagetidis]
MKITSHPAKRQATLDNRGLDLDVDGAEAFAGRTLTLADDRHDYGEPRFQTYGFVRGRLVMVVWTPRGEARHVISMRHCHDKEARKVLPYLA